jgi:hypothetical protein
VSGNPGGAKKIPEDIKQAFREISPAAVQKLFDLLDRGPPPVQLAAAREILDRHLGRPRQAVELTDKTPVRHLHVTTSMTEAEAAAAYAATIGAPTGPSEPDPVEQQTNGDSHDDV